MAEVIPGLWWVCGVGLGGGDKVVNLQMELAELKRHGP
jgi:hypothetical protein